MDSAAALFPLSRRTTSPSSSSSLTLHAALDSAVSSAAAAALDAASTTACTATPSLPPSATPTASPPSSALRHPHTMTRAFGLRSRSSSRHASHSDHPAALSPRSYSLRSPSLVSRSSAAVSDRILGHRSAADERSPSPHHHHRPPGPGGIIRRLSRGATQRLHRRTSHQHSLRIRESSAGPNLLRRRSNSNPASEATQDMSDLELDPSDDVPDATPGILPAATAAAITDAIAPAISAVLHTGTWATKYATKYTRVKEKRLRLWLDADAARVCWHPTNPLKSFFIDDIHDVRCGDDARAARDAAGLSAAHADRFLVIVYRPVHRQSPHRTTKTMSLLMDSDVVRHYWEDALDRVSRERSEIMNALSLQPEKSARSLALAWNRAVRRQHHVPGRPPDRAPSDQDRLSLDDARWICRQLEINCSDHVVRAHFARADPTHSGRLDRHQFRDFVASFRDRRDIRHLYRALVGVLDDDVDDEDEPTLPVSAFLAFLRRDQLVDVDRDRSYWETVFEKFADAPAAAAITCPVAATPSAFPTSEVSSELSLMSVTGFHAFLTSVFNAALAPAKTHAPLDRPLAEYFIASSHNTYLLGRQVAGTSSVEGYIAALIKGCRSVEIDCWDGDGGRPVVTHGRTMTTKVPFETCIGVIGKYAFHSSPYPLIVSLEVHCNAEQQRVMVDLMTHCWKGVLVTEPLPDAAATASTRLPSPEDLRHRIVVKVKAAEEGDASTTTTTTATAPLDRSTGRSRAHSLGSAFSRASSVEHHARRTPVASPPAVSPSDTRMSTPRGSTTSGPTVSPNSSADDSDEAATAARRPPLPAPRSSSTRTSRIIPELGRLGVYAQGIKFTAFAAPAAHTPNHIISLAENRFGKLCGTGKRNADDAKAALERHNARHLMRVYPQATRVGSSNFSPLAVWRRGVQMAALNWQTYDVHEEINEAMFAAGPDRLGYVLKPPELRPARHLPLDGPASPDLAASRPIRHTLRFAIDIISAQRLPRPCPQTAAPAAPASPHPSGPSSAPPAATNPYIVLEIFTPENPARGSIQPVAPSPPRASSSSSPPSSTSSPPLLPGAPSSSSSLSSRSATRRAAAAAGSPAPLRHRSPVVDANGFDPVWQHAVRVALETKHPALVFVRWAVWHAPEGAGGHAVGVGTGGSANGNGNGTGTGTGSGSANGNGSASANTGRAPQLLGSFTAKLASLRPGYRHLPLFNSQGHQFRDAKLFVRVRNEGVVVAAGGLVTAGVVGGVDGVGLGGMGLGLGLGLGMEAALGVEAPTATAMGRSEGVGLGDAGGSAIANAHATNGNGNAHATNGTATAPDLTSSPTTTTTRPHPTPERSWRSRVFCRMPSQRQKEREKARREEGEGGKEAKEAKEGVAVGDDG